MQSRICALAFWIFALGVGGGSSALAQEDSEKQSAPIYLTIEPGGLPAPVLKNPFEKVKTVPGHPVKISGVSALDLAGKTISVTVTPPQKPGDPPGPEAESKCPQDEEDPKLIAHGRTTPVPPTTVVLKVSSSGTFETTYTPQVEGDHEVLAAGGGYRGEASFEAEELENEECEDIPEEVIEEAQEISRGVCEIVQILSRKIEDLPPSPAKDEFREKLKEFEQELKRKPACGDPPDWAAGIGAINGMHKVSPHTRKVTKKIVHQFKTWLESARQINQQRPEVKSQLEAGNVLCDQLDIIINGLKFMDFMMNFLSGPKEFFAGFAKETLPMQLISAAPPMKRTPLMQSSLESLWKIVNNLPGREGDERRMARVKIGLDLTTLASSALFASFCQQFTGPVSGTMDVEFREKGELWWTYSIKFQGSLVLRYPKSAKGNQIPLTGEFYGNGTSFKSWDRAIPVLHRELAMGAIFKSWRLEPFGMANLPFLSNPSEGKKLAGVEVPDVNPVSVTLEKGGMITKSIFTPAFFRVPVRGDLREDTIVVQLEPAAKDFDDLRAKVFHIIGSVQGLLMPQFVSYALPYKGAHFILLRGMDDGPAEFKIEKGKNVMTIDRKFRRERSAGETKGTYTLSIRACNPGCDIPQPADPKTKL